MQSMKCFPPKICCYRKNYLIHSSQMMLPFQVSDAKCSPQSTAYPYVYHTVDGNAPAIIMGQASEVSFVPVVGMHAPLWNPRRILKSNKGKIYVLFAALVDN